MCFTYLFAGYSLLEYNTIRAEAFSSLILYPQHLETVPGTQ